MLRGSLTGSPRVGNQAFAECFEDAMNDACCVAYYRVTHWHDLVPDTPPHKWGYVHVGTEVWLNEHSVPIRVCPPGVVEPVEHARRRAPRPRGA